MDSQDDSSVIRASAPAAALSNPSLPTSSSTGQDNTVNTRQSRRTRTGSNSAVVGAVVPGEDQAEAAIATVADTSSSTRQTRRSSRGGAKNTSSTTAAEEASGSDSSRPARSRTRSSKQIASATSNTGSSSSSSATAANASAADEQVINQVSNASEPSAKSLGKRKAVSPSRTSDEQDARTRPDSSSVNTPERSISKRRRTSLSSSASTAPETPAQSYNLRPRGSASTSTSKLNPANSSQATPASTTSTPTKKSSTTTSRSRSSMPRRGRGGASGSGGSGARSGNTSLRAKAAANVAAAAANAANNSGRAAHANTQNSSASSSAASSIAASRRQREQDDLDEDALLGIVDAHEEMARQDDDMDEDDSDDDADDDEEEDEHDDSMQLIGGATMDMHHDDDEQDETSHLNTLSGGDPFDEDDDNGDDIDEDDDLHGGEGDMLDDDFEAPLTFDADGNPIAPHAASTTSGAANPASSSSGSGSGGAAGGTSSGDAWGSLGGSSMSAAARAALAAAAAADDDFGSFAASLRGYPSGFMGNMSGRLRGLLQNIRSKDMSVKMVALQELSEILSMSTEDTLAGYFSVDAFVKELVKCLRGSAHAAAAGLEGLDEDDEYAMAEAIAAAADAADTGEGGSEDEMQLLACRCLANLIEAMPAAAGNVVANGAVSVLCEKLLNITVIDLAEQTIATLEKLSEEMPAAIVREGGLAALLTYLDFFSIHVQRNAVTAAARCCQRLSVDSFDYVKEVMPILKNVLSYSDSRLVEQACLAITGVVESFRHHPDKLEILLTSDLLTAVAALLVPGQNPTVAAVDPSTHPKILKLLSTAAKSSPEIAIALVEADIVSTLYNLLTGISPPSEEEGLQGIKKHLEDDDMLVLNNLVHRSKEVVQETLSLINEILPALPKDGIFDPKAHMHRSKSSKVKKEEATPDTSLLSTSAPAESSSRLSQRATRSGRSTPATQRDASVAVKTEEITPALEDGLTTVSTSVPTTSGWDVGPRGALGGSTSLLANMLKNKEGNQERRLEVFQPSPTPDNEARRSHIKRFFGTLLPILLDVYVASIGVQVRSKTFQIMLKIVYFCDKEFLPTVLTIVPMASFLASCFSSKDQPALVLDALQMTELLLTKVPDTYQYFFRREGVMHELEQMARQPFVIVRVRSKKGKSAKSSSAATTPGDTTPQFGMMTPSDDGGDAGDLGTRIALAAGGSVSAAARANATMEGLQKDAITLRAQHLKKMLKDSSAMDGSLKADAELNKLRALVMKLKDVSSEGVEKDTLAAKDKAKTALTSLAALLTSGNIMSSFEIQESGLTGGLLEFATSGNGKAFSNDERRRMIMDTFLSGSDNANSALSHLVKRLQEALAKAEESDVLTALPSGGDSRHNPATMLARQLKIRLVASDQADMPKSLANVIVSIHAIATFQALNDYLRPRVASAMAAEERSRGSPLASPGTASSRLSGVLAAFAAATGMPPSDFEASMPNLANALSASAPSSLAGPSRTGDTSSAGAGSGRRRSTRLSARASTSNMHDSAAEQGTIEPVAAGSSTVAGQVENENSVACEDEDEGDDALDDDELLEEGLDLDPSGNEDRPVNFEVASDGSRVNASTPDGTRIQTPVPARSTAAAATSTSTATTRNLAGSRSGAGTPSSQLGGPAASQPAASRSYAAALRAAPADWHIEFFMGDRPVSMDTTIFGACYQHEVRNNSTSGARGIWHNVYSVTFKKVPGPPPSRDLEGTPEPPSYETALPKFLEQDPKQASILRLLGVLHRINADSAELKDKQIDYNHLDSSIVPSNVFVNNKLTAKLNRQLEEPMIVASDCLPDWAVQLPQIFPFLFPFETRYNFLQSTSFGYARLMQRWLQTTRPDTNSRRDENLSFLGRITRQKVRISRQKLFESAFKVFELYGSSKAMLEVEYFDEVGTGLGPTLEFYSLVSKEYRRKKLGIWREGDSPVDSEFVSNSRGLFPAPVDLSKKDTEAIDKYNLLFKTLGTLVAKAQMDSRIIDFPFNKLFMKLVLGQPVPLTTISIRAVDAHLAQSLEHLQKYLTIAEEIRANSSLSEAEQQEQIKSIAVDGAKIEDLALDFTVPGYDIELKEGGKDMHVTMENLSEYLDLVIEWTLTKGTKSAVAMFKEGFNQVFPVSHLHSFTPDELVKLFGDAEEDWSFTTISEHIKADHGYTLGSSSITNFISFMSELDPVHRRKVLSFMTGASRLPIGGFAGLNPPLTVVRKIPEDGADPDSVLPSVMTCVSYLKLPNYSSKEIMERQLMKAIDEGGSGFHLS